MVCLSPKVNLPMLAKFCSTDLAFKNGSLSSKIVYVNGCYYFSPFLPYYTLKKQARSGNINTIFIH